MKMLIIKPKPFFEPFDLLISFETKAEMEIFINVLKHSPSCECSFEDQMRNQLINAVITKKSYTKPFKI